jgi:hypothetical protein
MQAWSRIYECEGQRKKQDMLIRKMKNSLERTNDRLRMGIENELFQKDRSDEANFTRKKKKKLTIKAMMANADSFIGEKR